MYKRVVSNNKSVVKAVSNNIIVWGSPVRNYDVIVDTKDVMIRYISLFKDGRGYIYLGTITIKEALEYETLEFDDMIFPLKDGQIKNYSNNAIYFSSKYSKSSEMVSKYLTDATDRREIILKNTPAILRRKFLVPIIPNYVQIDSTQELNHD